MILYSAVILAILTNGYGVKSHRKANTRPIGFTKPEPNALNTGELAKLIHKVNKDDGEDSFDDNNDGQNLYGDQKAAFVDLDYIGMRNTDDAVPLSKIMELLQKNYDANNGNTAADNEVRLHYINNPAVLQQYRDDMRKRHHSTSSSSGDSESSDYELRLEKLLRRNAVFRLERSSIDDDKPVLRMDDERIKKNSRDLDKIIHFESRNYEDKQKIAFKDTKENSYDSKHFDKLGNSNKNKNDDETGSRTDAWDMITKKYNSWGDDKKEIKKFNDEYKKIDNHNHDYKKNDKYNDDYKNNNDNKNNDDYKKKESFNGDYKKKDSYNDDYKKKDSYNSDYKKKDSHNDDYKKKDSYNDDYKKKDSYNDDYKKKDDYNDDYKKKDSYNDDYKKKDSYNSDYKNKDSNNDDLKKKDRYNDVYKKNVKQNEDYKKSDTYNDDYKSNDKYHNDMKNWNDKDKQQIKVKKDINRDEEEKKMNWDKPKKKKSLKESNWDTWKSKSMEKHHMPSHKKENLEEWGQNQKKESLSHASFEKQSKNDWDTRDDFKEKPRFTTEDWDRVADNKKSRPRIRGSVERFSVKAFGRTSIPFVGKKGIYEDK